ncbi:hypothetical protein [Nocardioides sp.]|uniref:hypothetical protein n=1 Tax=Nocardioides sp. TaxID=35761 RepID=UPI00356A3036
MADDQPDGIHLTRAGDRADAVAALADLLGGRVGPDAVLADLNRRARRSRVPGRAPGSAVEQALAWDRADRCTRRWWPQGISSSADASPHGTAGDDFVGRRVLVTSWYARPVHEDGDDGSRGARISFVDLATRRYRHVLLVTPKLDAEGRLQLNPLRVHAGGIVWWGGHLYVAATARGFWVCRLDDLLRVPDAVASGDPDRLGIRAGRVSSFGYRYLLPVSFQMRGGAEPGAERLRWSFLSVDRAATPPELVAGEYGRGDQSRRLARFALDPTTGLPAANAHGVSRPLAVDHEGVAGTQGVAIARGEQYRTVSHGPLLPGTVVVGRGGRVRRHRAATPVGPEDLTYWASTDLLWSLTEHPGRRWICAMRRSTFDR